MKYVLRALAALGILFIWVTGIIFYVVAQTIEWISMGINKIAQKYIAYMNKRAIRRGEMLP